MKQRTPFQKILMAIAFISYFTGIFCGAAAVYVGEGGQDPVTASLMASIVFFVGVGIVLQVIGSSNLPDLKINR
ncbi:MAG: hemerythrin family protein [Candidatus Thiodiazotropha endolucinida]